MVPCGSKCSKCKENVALQLVNFSDLIQEICNILSFSAQPENKLPGYHTFYSLFEAELTQAYDQLDVEERTSVITRFGQNFLRNCVYFILNEMIIAEFVELDENGLLSLKTQVPPDCGWFVV